MTLSTNAIERIFSYFLAGKSYQNFEKTRKMQTPCLEALMRCPMGSAVCCFFWWVFPWILVTFAPWGLEFCFLFFDGFCDLL